MAAEWIEDETLIPVAGSSDSSMLERIGYHADRTFRKAWIVTASATVYAVSVCLIGLVLRALQSGIVTMAGNPGHL